MTPINIHPPNLQVDSTYIISAPPFSLYNNDHPFSLYNNDYCTSSSFFQHASLICHNVKIIMSSKIGLRQNVYNTFYINSIIAATKLEL